MANKIPGLLETVQQTLTPDNRATVTNDKQNKSTPRCVLTIAAYYNMHCLSKNKTNDQTFETEIS